MNKKPLHIDEITLAAYLNGELNQSRASEVEQWIATSHEHREVFRAVQKIWTMSGDYLPEPAAVDIHAAWQKLDERMKALDKSTAQRISNQHPSWYTIPLKVAAVLLPIIFGTYIIFLPIHSTQANNQLIAVNTPGLLELPDSSRVELNNKASLSYPSSFNNETRRIKLSGEAYFNVKPAKNKPFIVEVIDRKLDVIVKGTAFNVKEYADSVTVIVEEGLVLMACHDSSGTITDSMYIAANERGVFHLQSKNLIHYSTYDENKLFWKTNTLSFNKTPLNKVFETISEAYHINHQFSDNDLKQLRLTTSFNNMSLEKVLQIIEESFNIQISKNDSLLIVDENTP